MSQSLSALLFAAAAGFSTLFGALVVFITKKKNEKLVSVSLGFAAGVMISVTFSDLLPNSGAMLSSAWGIKPGALGTVGFLVLGILFASAIDRFVPHQAYSEATDSAEHRDIFRVGLVSMLAIALHNLPEGMATFMAGYQNAELGASIAVAIALHNIPEGITVAMPVYFATGSKKKAFLYTFYSGVAEPVGALLAYLILKPFISQAVLGALFGVVSGIMLYIAVEELIPSSRQYGHNKHAIAATFSGICMMLLTHIL